MNQTDKQIHLWTKGIAKSDRDAFERFFRLMYPRLIQFAYKYTQSKPVASDIVQDAFVILWEKRTEADPARSLKAYIYRIVRNRALNHIRDHMSRKVRLETLDNSPQAVQDADDSENEKLHLTELLRAWIDDLPERQQEAFELSRFEGLDHDEIGRVMDISSNTVNNHIVAALQQLRNRYKVFKQEERG